MRSHPIACLLHRILVVSATCGLCLLPHPSSATTVITAGPFDITFYGVGETDGSGTTGSQNWTAEQIADVAACVSTWSSMIANVPVRQVTMHCFWNNFGTSTLGGASSTIVGDGTTAWSMTELLWREGFDFTPTNYYSDARIVYDDDAVGYGWNFGEDEVGSMTIDFRSVVTHEIGHALGFMGTYSSSTDTWWSGGVTAWNSLLRDSAGNAPSPGATGSPGNFNQLDNPVYFVGANALAVYGGPVPVYAPDPYQSGSSLSHLDKTVFGTSLMTPSISLGQMTRTPSALEWAIMQDLGWTLVPEPGTFLLSACGLLMIGWVRRRK